jgi:hypothetical protein
MDKPRSFAPIIAAVLLLPVLYVGSYLALVRPPELGLVRHLRDKHGISNYLNLGSWANGLFWPWSRSTGG